MVAGRRQHVVGRHGLDRRPGSGSSSSSGSSWTTSPASAPDDRARRLEAEREDADEEVAGRPQLGVGDAARRRIRSQLGDEVARGPGPSPRC